MFHGSTQIDGVKCSVLMDKQAPPDRIVDDFGFLVADKETYVALQDSGAYSKVVGIDTGRGVWFAAHWGKDARCDDMEGVDMEEEKRKKVVYKVGQWLEKSGSRYSKKKNATWTQSNPAIQELISTGIASPKTGSYALFSVHVHDVMNNRDQLINFYSPRKWRHLKWKKSVSLFYIDL